MDSLNKADAVLSTGVLFFLVSFATSLCVKFANRVVSNDHCDGDYKSHPSLRAIDTTSDSGQKSSYAQLVGNTPLIRLTKLSNMIGRNVYAKMESMNPSGTGKDRAVQHMLHCALHLGIKQEFLNPSDRRSSLSAPESAPESTSASVPVSAEQDIYEGTSGSTGIALAFQCNALGRRLYVVLPDDQALEKRQLLEKLGAIVHIVPSCAIANKDHYVNTARRLAEENNGIFVNQFENLANYQAHYCTTGPEIWQQMEGKEGNKNRDTYAQRMKLRPTRKRISAFVMSSGTGGTIAGVSKFLKEKDASIRIVLADPFGSSLFNKVMHNVCYAPQQAERRIRKHRYDSIVEGVGLDRVTANFDAAKIDHALTVPDQEIVLMAHWLLANEGLFVGSSSALNVAAAVLTAKTLPEESNIVTVICDSGYRHMSRFWNREYIEQSAEQYNLRWPGGTCCGYCAAAPDAAAAALNGVLLSCTENGSGVAGKNDDRDSFFADVSESGSGSANEGVSGVNLERRKFVRQATLLDVPECLRGFV